MLANLQTNINVSFPCTVFTQVQLKVIFLWSIKVISMIKYSMTYWDCIIKMYNWNSKFQKHQCHKIYPVLFYWYLIFKFNQLNFSVKMFTTEMTNDMNECNNLYPAQYIFRELILQNPDKWVIVLLRYSKPNMKWLYDCILSRKSTYIIDLNTKPISVHSLPYTTWLHIICKNKHNKNLDINKYITLE